MKFGEMLIAELVQTEWGIQHHRQWTEEEG
jgi:hypothetical protein